MFQTLGRPQVYSIKVRIELTYRCPARSHITSCIESWAERCTIGTVAATVLVCCHLLTHLIIKGQCSIDCHLVVVGLITDYYNGIYLHIYHIYYTQRTSACYNYIYTLVKFTTAKY